MVAQMSTVPDSGHARRRLMAVHHWQIASHGSSKVGRGRPGAKHGNLKGRHWWPRIDINRKIAMVDKWAANGAMRLSQFGPNSEQ